MILGRGGRHNVRGKENCQDSLNSNWIPNFRHNFCPACWTKYFGKNISIFLSRKGDFPELPTPPISILFLKSCCSKTVAEVQELIILRHQPNENEARK